MARQQGGDDLSAERHRSHRTRRLKRFAERLTADVVVYRQAAEEALNYARSKTPFKETVDVLRSKN